MKCTFDPFNRGRHVYTFENRCNEESTDEVASASKSKLVKEINKKI